MMNDQPGSVPDNQEDTMALLKRYAEPGTIRHWKEEMDSLFDDLFSWNRERELNGGLLSGWTPKADIMENEKEYVVMMDLPGMEKKEIKVSMQESRLMVTGERKEEKKEEKSDFIRRERFEGSFYRSFLLSEPVKESAIKASFKDGVLRINIPKAEVRKPKVVTID